MKRILVTGASGFIGQHCLPILTAKGYEVHAVAAKANLQDKPATNVFWHKVDLLESAQTSALLAEVQPTYLLHLAWYAVPGAYWTSPQNVRWVAASLHLLQQFLAHGGQRIVTAGTCAEYDWQYGYCSENVTPLAPTTLYGSCKHALQLVQTAFANQTKLSAAWSRLFFLYGPQEYPARLVSSVILALLKHEAANCSHGNQIRDFLYVADVAAAFIALLESEVTGSVNIASGQPISLKQVIYKIAEQLQQPELIKLGAVSAPANEPPLLVADTRRLFQEVGWSPSYNIDEGLQQTIEWWKQQLADNKNNYQV